MVAHLYGCRTAADGVECVLQLYLYLLPLYLLSLHRLTVIRHLIVVHEKGHRTADGEALHTVGAEERRDFYADLVPLLLFLCLPVRI